MDAGRLGWLIASTVVVAALQRAVDQSGRSLFLLKGGTYLQHRMSWAGRPNRAVHRTRRRGPYPGARRTGVAAAPGSSPALVERLRQGRPPGRGGPAPWSGRRRRERLDRAHRKRRPDVVTGRRRRPPRGRHQWWPHPGGLRAPEPAGAGRTPPTTALLDLCRSAGANASITGPHTALRWRHTYASLSLARGVDLYVVSRLLGHARAETTQRYLHLDTGALTEAVRRAYP